MVITIFYPNINEKVRLIHVTHVTSSESIFMFFFLLFYNTLYNICLYKPYDKVGPVVFLLGRCVADFYFSNI